MCNLFYAGVAGGGRAPTDGWSPTAQHAVPWGLATLDPSHPRGNFPKIYFGPGESFIRAMAIAVNCDRRTFYGRSSHPALRSYGLLDYLNRVSLAGLSGTGVIDRMNANIHNAVSVGG